MNARLLFAMVPAAAALLICFAANLRAEKAKKYYVHVNSAMGACSRLIAWVFAAFFLLVATSNFAQEQEKRPARSVSPDGKWELRPGAAGEQHDFVIAKAGSNETSLVLSEEEYVDGLAERWVERLATQTSFGRRTQNALHLTFSRARAIKRRNFINSPGTRGASSIR
jgi:hypothetical protein